MKHKYITILVAVMLIGSTLITVATPSEAIDAFDSSDKELKSLVTMIAQRVVEVVTNVSTKCVVTDFHKSKVLLGFSGKYTIHSMDADIRCGIYEFKVDASILNNRITRYVLRPHVPLNESSPILFDPTLLRKVMDIISVWYDIHRDSYLISANKMLEKYIMECNELKNTTIEFNNAIMNLMVIKSVSGWMDFVAIRWVFKVNNIPTYYLEPTWDFSIVVSPQGFVIDIADNRGVAKIKQVSINIGEDRALEIARPIAEKNVKQFNVEIVETNAKLYYVRDVYGVRGDELAMYPCWVVMFLFNKSVDGNIGYVVYVSADNGEILNQHWMSKQWLLLELPPERGELALETDSEDGREQNKGVPLKPFVDIQAFILWRPVKQKQSWTILPDDTIEVDIGVKIPINTTHIPAKLFWRVEVFNLRSSRYEVLRENTEELRVEKPTTVWRNITLEVPWTSKIRVSANVTHEWEDVGLNNCAETTIEIDPDVKLEVVEKPTTVTEGDAFSLVLNIVSNVEPGEGTGWVSVIDKTTNTLLKRVGVSLEPEKTIELEVKAPKNPSSSQQYHTIAIQFTGYDMYEANNKQEFALLVKSNLPQPPTTIVGQQLFWALIVVVMIIAVVALAIKTMKHRL